MHNASAESLTQLRQIYDSNKETALQEFFTFLKFPSISSDPAYAQDVAACAQWLQEYIADMEFAVEIWESPGHHPVLYASWYGAGRDAPVLLIYNHYDVQPVDPLDKWISPPFEPTIRDGAIYARGAQDNKGQCFYVLQALKTLKARDGSLPMNIKLCIEGEEECGSSGLSRLLSEKASRLKADYVAVVDLGIKAPTVPSITLGIRGIVTMEMEVSGPHIDLHSGSHGGMIYNPIKALVEILAQAYDQDGRVTIPGFYDDIDPLTPEDKAKLSFDFDENEYTKTFGAPATGGERSLSPLERNWLRPTLEINGIWGGYTGLGFKTVIPAKAYAKLSCRLVPNQSPQKMGDRIARFLEQQAPPGTSVTVKVSEGSGPAARAEINSKLTKAFALAYQEVYAKPCQYIYTGASIPVAAALARTCQGELILLGVGLDDDAIHSPNERFSIDRLEKGTLLMARGIEFLAQSLPEASPSKSSTLSTSEWEDGL
jgi:acetylornithine deacetylase/succinyl-diaminopimelate desuccinylase-like protein